MNNEKFKLLARLLKEEKITINEFVILVSEEKEQVCYPINAPFQHPYGWGYPVYCLNTLTTNLNTNE